MAQTEFVIVAGRGYQARRFALKAREISLRLTFAINQLKNYLWSQLGQVTLYEILVREGFDAARRVVNRLVTK
jgi:hypothetical protein